MDGRSKTSADNGKKGGRPITTATLKTQMARERLAQKIEEEFEALVQPQIDKAKAGDTTAFNSLWDKAIIKPPTQTENKNIKEYRLDDPELQKKAEAFVELQKHGTGGNQGST